MHDSARELTKLTPEADIESRVREIALRLAGATGLELVLAELLRMAGRLTVRLTIDREGGVTLEDCANFSRSLGAALEVEDPIPGAYRLEVSSPGLDRRLVKDTDYERFRGRVAKIALFSPLAGRRNFRGTIGGLESGDILLEIEGGQVVRLPLAAVEKARLVPEF